MRPSDSFKTSKGGYNSPRVSSEIEDCALPLTFDSYSLCSFGCLYCFAFYQKVQRGAASAEDGKIDIVHATSKNIIDSMSGKSNSLVQRRLHDHFYSKRFPFHWGGLADPFCYIERKNRKGLEIIEYLAAENYPTIFSTKGNVMQDKDFKKIFLNSAKYHNFAFQISMVTADDKAGRFMEPYVPIPTVRFKVMRWLSDQGYYTILRLRPFIIGLTDDTLDELLEKARDAGAQAVSTEFFCLEGRLQVEFSKRFDYISQIIGLKDARDLLKYMGELSPGRRGSYKRLNRVVKEEHVKKIYTFCQKNGMTLSVSDPDFKELGMTGCCCGIPYNYKPNPELSGWSRTQLTHHLIVARRNFQRGLSGKDIQLCFGDVYPDEGYLSELAFCEFNLRRKDIIRSQQMVIAQRHIIQAEWNHYRSPANPANYLDGKVEPIGLDDSGNVIYEYKESDYERRWKGEGIVLTE